MKNLFSRSDRKIESFKRKSVTYPIIGIIIALIAVGAVAAQAHNRASFMRFIHITMSPKFTPHPAASDEPTAISDELKEHTMTDSSLSNEPTTPSPAPSDTAESHNGSSSVSVHIENNTSGSSSQTNVSSSSSSSTTISGTKNSHVSATGDAQVHQDPTTGTTTVNGKNFSVHIEDGDSGNNSKVNINNRTTSSTRVRTSISNHTTTH